MLLPLPFPSAFAIFLIAAIIPIPSSLPEARPVAINEIYDRLISMFAALTALLIGRGSTDLFFLLNAMTYQ
jgi:hypothetical protein